MQPIMKASPLRHLTTLTTPTLMTVRQRTPYHISRQHLLAPKIPTRKVTYIYFPDGISRKSLSHDKIEALLSPHTYRPLTSQLLQAKGLKEQSKHEEEPRIHYVKIWTTQERYNAYLSRFNMAVFCLTVVLESFFKKEERSGETLELEKGEEEEGKKSDEEEEKTEGKETKVDYKRVNPLVRDSILLDIAVGGFFFFVD